MLKKYINPDHVANEIAREFERVRGELDVSDIEKYVPDKYKHESLEKDFTIVFNGNIHNLTRLVDHALYYAKGDKTGDRSPYISRDIEQIAGKVKAAKTLLHRIDQLWKDKNNTEDQHPDIKLDRRSYLDTFTWEKLRHFTPEHNYYLNSDPKPNKTKDTYSYISPNKRKETYQALNSALTPL